MASSSEVIGGTALLAGFLLLLGVAACSREPEPWGGRTRGSVAEEPVWEKQPARLQKLVEEHKESLGPSQQILIPLNGNPCRFKVDYWRWKALEKEEQEAAASGVSKFCVAKGGLGRVLVQDVVTDELLAGYDPSAGLETL